MLEGPFKTASIEAFNAAKRYKEKLKDKVSIRDFSHMCFVTTDITCEK